jgi:hypothetical protein
MLSFSLQGIERLHKGVGGFQMHDMACYYWKRSELQLLVLAHGKFSPYSYPVFPAESSQPDRAKYSDKNTKSGPQASRILKGFKKNYAPTEAL